MKSNRYHVSFEWAWDHAKTEYPHVYEAAFGKPTADTAPAATDAEKQPPRLVSWELLPTA